jgi:hypothetical protein
MPQFEFRRSLDGVSFDRNEQIAMAWVMVWKGGQEPPEDKDWVLVELEPTPEPALAGLRRQPMATFRVPAGTEQADIKRAINDAKQWAEARDITRVYVRTGEP